LPEKEAAVAGKHFEAKQESVEIEQDGVSSSIRPSQ